MSNLHDRLKDVARKCAADKDAFRILVKFHDIESDGAPVGERYVELDFRDMGVFFKWVEFLKREIGK